MNAAVIGTSGRILHAAASAPVIYGTDGYDLYATSPVGTTVGYSGAGPFGPTRLTQLPSYITSITAPARNTYAGGSSYSTIDNPAGGVVEAGFTGNQLTFTLGAGAPSTFYVGYITNIDASALDYPTILQFSQVGGKHFCNLFWHSCG